LPAAFDLEKAMGMRVFMAFFGGSFIALGSYRKFRERRIDFGKKDSATYYVRAVRRVKNISRDFHIGR
jgi:hypothetical protein